MINGKTIFSNIMWRLAERSGSQVILFIVYVVLTRLLPPEEFGVISLITIITGILNLFVDAGFGNALIQKQCVDQTDYSTVFYLNVTFGIVFYIGMYIAAPSIADFYGQNDIISYIRVLSLTLIVGGFGGVQQALVAKKIEYKKLFFSSLTGTLLSGIISIVMAFKGFGVWSLVAQKLIDQVLDTAILWFTVHWRPSFCFSMERMKPLAVYGSKLLGSSLLYSATNNMTGLLVGKIFSTLELAYYEKGRQVPMLLVNNIQAIVQSILFPALAEQQTQQEWIRKMLRQSIMISAYCIFPCMVGIAVCAKPLVRILFTEQWIGLVPYLQIWCCICITYLLDTANLQVIQALGRSDIFLKIEIIKEVITIVSLLVTLPFGVLVMLMVSCIERPLFWYINAKPCRELVGYGFGQQLKELKSIIVLNLILAISVWGIGFLPLHDFALLTVQVLSGVGIYLAGSIVLRIEAFGRILQLGRAFLCIRSIIPRLPKRWKK